MVKNETKKINNIFSQENAKRKVYLKIPSNNIL